MRVEKTIENAERCKCLQCPSYTAVCKMKNGTTIPHDISKLDHLERMFCAFEESNCIHENRGCLCETCPVHKKYSLNDEDYCLHTGGVM